MNDTQWKFLTDEFAALRLQITEVDNKVIPIPQLVKSMSDVRTTLYDPETGLTKMVTIIKTRQDDCQAANNPGNKAEQNGNKLAGTAIAISVIMMIVTLITQLGGCKMTFKDESHLGNLKQVDTLQEYNELKKEITALVRKTNKDVRLEVTGDRTYQLEADGSIYMCHADQRRPVSRWRREEWLYFREDMKNNRLRERIDALN